MTARSLTLRYATRTNLIYASGLRRLLGVWRRSLGTRSNSLPHECFASRPQRHTTMSEPTPLPFDLPAVRRKKLTVDFDWRQPVLGRGLLLLRETERSLGVCARLADSLTDRRDPNRIEHSLVEMIKTRVIGRPCGWLDLNSQCNALGLARVELGPTPKLWNGFPDA